MSVADLREYAKRITEAKELVEKAKDKGFTDVAAQAEIAKDLGLDFTQKDVDDLAKSQADMTEEELKNTAAGFVTSTAAGVAATVATVSAAVVGSGAAVAATTSSGGW